MANIGSRLEAALTILKSLSPIKAFADIGSDHAFLAIEAKKRGYVEQALATDINAMPLQKGKENAIKQGISVDFILSDGFDALEGKHIDCAAVCGMGGELIASIIARSELAKNSMLILQPMSSQEMLRGFLWKNGYEIKKEYFVCENSKPYSVMFAEYTGKSTAYGITDAYLGKERPHNAEFRRYAAKVLSGAKKRLKGERITGRDTSNTEALIAECQMHTDNLSGGQ